MGCCGGFIGKVYDTVVDAPKEAVNVVNEVVVEPVLDTTNKIIVDPIKDNWVEIRDTTEAAAVIAGNYVAPGSSLISSQLVSDGAKEKLATDELRLANLAAGAAGSGAFNSAPTDPNVVGGVTGPDNIDVGGGFNPATGATAAELEAARAALETQAFVPPVSDANYVNGSDIASDSYVAPSVSDTAANFPDNIDAGGGWSPATGATSAELAAASKAMEGGMTFQQAMNYVRAGTLLNALAGDPLGLSSTPSGDVGTGSTGFQIVPVPTDWKSPTYQAASAPIDLNSIFSNQDLLQGTQFQGLQNIRNPSFNEIFAQGPVSANMGQPVNINDIVGAILGQSATSQKSA